MSNEDGPRVRVLEKPDSGAMECLEETAFFAQDHPIESLFILGVTEDGRPFIHSNRMSDRDRFYLIGLLNVYVAQNTDLE